MGILPVRVWAGKMPTPQEIKISEKELHTALSRHKKSVVGDAVPTTDFSFKDSY